VVNLVVALQEGFLTDKVASLILSENSKRNISMAKIDCKFLIYKYFVYYIFDISFEDV